MQNPDAPSPPTHPIRRWVRRAFIAWAIISTGWVIDSFRTRAVAPELLASSSRVVVTSTDESLTFAPIDAAASGLLFVVGGGVAAEAYAPLLRPLADQGHRVHIVRLPYRLAPWEPHRQEAVRRIQEVLAATKTGERWVLAGHSLGGVIVCRVAATGPPQIAELVLVGTSHPRDVDLAKSAIPITKIFATHDGLASVEKVQANRRFLPVNTRWVEIVGGNHAQFGNYGRQLLDGKASIGRTQQQTQTRDVLLAALERARG